MFCLHSHSSNNHFSQSTLHCGVVSRRLTEKISLLNISACTTLFLKLGCYNSFPLTDHNVLVAHQNRNYWTYKSPHDLFMSFVLTHTVPTIIFRKLTHPEIGSIQKRLTVKFFQDVWPKVNALWWHKWPNQFF